MITTQWYFFCTVCWMKTSASAEEGKTHYTPNAPRIAIWNKTLLCKSAELAQTAPAEDKICARGGWGGNKRHSESPPTLPALIEAFCTGDSTTRKQQSSNERLMRRASRHSGSRTMRPGVANDVLKSRIKQSKESDVVDSDHRALEGWWMSVSLGRHYTCQIYCTYSGWVSGG